MKARSLACVLGIVVLATFGPTGPALADTLFSDGFDSGFDTTKWQVLWGATPTVASSAMTGPAHTKLFSL